MKLLLIVAAFFVQFGMFAQEPCEFSVSINDSIGSYKETKQLLVFERNFAGTSSYVYFSLVSDNGMPMLNVQFITRSKNFIAANCLDKNSRLYVQMNNGKIVTLMHVDDLNCGTNVRDENGYNNQIMSANFVFLKDNFEQLQSSPASVIRIKYTTETQDYILQGTLLSELDGKSYTPENYFVTELDCILN